MSLLKVVQDKVPSKIFSRGKRYYYNDRILSSKTINVNVNKLEIIAVVAGSMKYNLSLQVNLKDNKVTNFSGDCTCPYWGDICKHQVAVMYKFLIEDFPKLELGKVIRDDHFNRLVELTKTSETPVPLKYYIKGLYNGKLVNFKITLVSEQLTEEKIDEIILYIHNPFFFQSYMPINLGTRRELEKDIVKAGLTPKDKLNIEFLVAKDTKKSKTPNSLLLPKDKDTFNFILNLVKEEQVYFMENGEKASIGDTIYPKLILHGDEKKVKIKREEIDYPVYEDGSLTWTVIDNCVHPVEMSTVADLPDEIEIPEHRKGEFLFEIIPALAKDLGIEIDENLQGYELIEMEPLIKLELDYQSEMILCRSEVEISDKIFINSNILELDFQDKHYQVSEEEPKLWNCWDINSLQDLVRFLEDYEFHVSSDSFFIKNKNDIQEFITDGFLHIPEDWEVVTTPAFDQLEVMPFELEPKIELVEDDNSDRIDWFEFNITYSLGGKTYTREEIQRLLRYNKRGKGYIQLGSQYFVISENEKEEKVKKALDLAEVQEDGNYRSNYFNLMYYRNLVEEAGINFQGNKVYDELNQDITKADLVKEVEIPLEVEDVLRDYQKKGYYWLRFLDKYRFGGILADDMGLGKTIQTLTFLKGISKKRPALIICPRTLIYNWSDEVEKFFPNTNYLVYYGTPQEREEMREELSDYELVISSYSIISRDAEDLAKKDFSYCILDEAQNIKNHKTQRARGVKKIKAGGKLALTGTPIENSAKELWSIFDFLMKGYLGNNNQFTKKYDLSNKGKEQVEKLSELKKRVAPFILRRRKEEVLKELPEKLINIHKVEMTKLQADTYQAILEETKKEVFETVKEKGFNRSQINILSVLTKLRQVCNHPSLVLKEVDKKIQSGKMEALMEIIDEAISGGHKMVVFSQFVKMLKLIRRELKKSGISFEYLDGGTKNRMERVNRFNNEPEIPVFLISLKAGGVGLNLTGADTVIHVDPWWNPMVEQQATDRTHRIGQEKRVMVYKLITKGTVEEKMIKLQDRKRDIFNSVIEDNVSPLEAITWDDIQELLEY